MVHSQEVYLLNHCVSPLIISHAGWEASSKGDTLLKLASQSIKWHTPGLYISNNLYIQKRKLQLKFRIQKKQKTG